MQMLATENIRQTILPALLFLAIAAGATLLACGPVTQPIPENTSILPATPNTPMTTEPAPSPGGDLQTIVETYAAVRIWTCVNYDAPSGLALVDWLHDQGITGVHIVSDENYIIADRVAASLLDALSQQSGVFGVDHIRESIPPSDYRHGDDIVPPPPPFPALKYPKLDRYLDSLVLASRKCPGVAWPADADPQVVVKIFLRDNPDTPSTQAVVSWLKANGISIQDSFLYKRYVEGYGDGSIILLDQFPASLLLPLSEQPGVTGINKYVPETAHPAVCPPC